MSEYSLFKELSRRKVFRAAIVYLSVAWILLQIAELTFPRLGLPDWAVTLVLAITGIGLPLIMVAAWAFELQPENESADSAQPSPSSRPSFVPWLELVILALLIAIVSYLYISRHSSVDDLTSSNPAVPDQQPPAQHMPRRSQRLTAAIPEPASVW